MTRTDGSGGGYLIIYLSERAVVIVVVVAFGFDFRGVCARLFSVYKFESVAGGPACEKPQYSLHYRLIRSYPFKDVDITSLRPRH
ncbi:hypothetical protein HETIRDRAFT_422026 [Heterobasidion irregulare TC 32-1]|uniref:Uncharacterized protein n=1 Tax=Heterobasidion irregulare (strain TC 32-1) TaxID=747525 RepID=W4JSU1_HETIT|nr:uncharacterized protein HETIRDRAFT_422026 [Heterobasidion irregulare TC 32-1]ETW76608.1 hypothetical protein HETIRDRAFT_422026 [Heterobasidion irregulare TC 32-1]